MKYFLLLCLVSIEYLATTTQVISLELMENMWDKANHFIAFFVLYILLSLSYKKLFIYKKIIILMLFGLQIEIAQSFIDGRFFSILDTFADTIGVFIGVLVFNILF